MKKSLKAKYLEQFPEKYRTFVHNRFSQAYIFPEQSCEFGTEDVIQPAQGPATLKARVVEACESMFPGMDEERQKVLQTVIDTIEDSTEFILEVKQEIDVIWKEARKYQEAHPKVDKKAAEPATEKQLSWLKSLGCPEVPKTKGEASKLIDKYKNNKQTSYARRRVLVS